MTYASNRAPVVAALLRAPARSTTHLCALVKAPARHRPKQHLDESSVQPVRQEECR